MNQEALKPKKPYAELQDILNLCGTESIISAREPTTGTAYYEFNRAIFVRKFLKYWLYNEDNESFPESDSAFGSYVFLLQKNISVTNITLPEQIALLRIHARNAADTDKLSKVEFFTTRQYRRFFERLIPDDSYKYSEKDAAKSYAESICSDLQNYFADFLFSTMAVSYYATSFVVHIPRSIRINLQKVVGESGYIHSMGRQIYVSRSETSNNTILLDNLDRYRELSKAKKPIFFAPYSQEYFSDEATRTAYSMDHGLSDVKIVARKQYIGTTNLLDFVSDVSNGDGFLVPKSNDYVAERSKVADKVESDVTIFLFVDSGLEYSKTTRSLRKADDLYLICYAQVLKSANKLSIIKERKPGWSGPVTIPHTLSSAIINVARQLFVPYAPDEPLIFDPFCGGSTFLLDAAVRIPGAKLVGVDRHPLFQCMNTDNFHLLSDPNTAGLISNFAESASGALADSKLAAISLHIIELISQIKSSGGDLDVICAPQADAKQKISTAIAQVVSELAFAADVEFNNIGNAEIKSFRDSDSHFTPNLVRSLSAWKSVRGRAAFYFVWRAISNGSHKIERSDSPQEWIRTVCANIVRPELDQVKLEFSDISDVDAAAFDGDVSEQFCEPRFELTKGLYSKEVRLKNQYLASILDINSISFLDTDSFISNLRAGNSQSKISLLSGDSLEFMRDVASGTDVSESFRPNFIVSDPPYSFNVQEGDQSDMQSLFHDLVYLIPKIIAKRGVASIVVPSFSRNGQTIPFYQSNEVFTRRMLAACAKENRELISVSQSFPDSVTFPKLPYSWTSQRGVSRFVLNFMIE